MPVEIGSTISQYKIVKKLGEGGMGVVYLADDTKLNRRVAIKLLPPGITSNQTDRERFLREAQAAAAINHPHVCVIHDIQEQDNLQFIIMEYVPGHTLSEKLSAQALAIEKIIEYAIQIASALQAAHSKEIIHRDIKSDNIMISEHDEIKVMDFGLAKIKGSTQLTKPMNIVGTLAYMSPEQIEGKDLDAGSDIFSFGVVLYEMSTGRKPFWEEYESALIYSILNEEPKPVSQLNRGIPLELEKIINKTLAKNRSERYHHMSDLLLDLARLEKKISSHMFIPSGSEKITQLTENPIQSIVVLPLKNYSNEPEQEYFVDGITEALITQLAKLHSLRIISRTSAMHYKSTDKSLPEIARELNVDAVVEGSVLRAGNKVRITAQLIHAVTDDYIWAEQYDRDLSDILQIQSEVARAIASEIRVKLSQKEKQRLTNIRPVNPESYDAYLKGRFHWYKLSPQNVQKALEYFSIALEKDPDFALAHTGIAMVRLAQGYWGTAPSRESMPQAKFLVLAAIEMDDSLEEAHDALARILFFYDWDWTGAEREFKLAIQLNPNKADVHLFYSSYLRSMNRGDEAMSEAQLGLELDPLNSFSQCHYVGQLMFMNQYDQALLLLKKILQQESGFPFLHRYLWICYQQKGMYDDAIEHAKNFFSAMGKSEFSEAIVEGYNNADFEQAMGLLARKMEEHSRHIYVQPVWIARLYAYARDPVNALVWLEKAYEERDLLMPNLNTSFDWENLREEVGFKNLIKKMNFPQ